MCKPQRGHKLQITSFSLIAKQRKNTVLRYHSDINMKKKLSLGFISLQGKHAEDDRGSPGPFTRNVQK